MERVGRPTGEGFRPDLEGLRGVAILLVLLFHAGIPGTGGGFVGVDVFFVLSGFLITGLLIRERERSGRIDLPAFYARRARRILPAAAVVVVATLALSWVFLGPLDLERVTGDAIACVLSVANLRFAASTMDYFTAAQTPSPLLHYWSLGVEEQFYLVWPALLILATRGSRPRVAAAGVLAAVLVASFVAGLILTDAAAAWAFYSLPTRAWQLALGGLLAATVAWQARLPDRFVAALGWLGLGAIVASLALIDPSTPYPGLAALVPTLGAGAVVLSGARPWSPGALLVIAPLRFLGRISYSLYLIHWPLLVLPAAGLAIGTELPLAERLGLALAAVGLAWLSYRFVEEPIHRGRRFALPAWRTLGLAGAAIVAVVALSLGLGMSAAQTLDSYSASAVGGQPATGSGGADDTLPGDVGSIAPDSSVPPEPSLLPDVTAPASPAAGGTSSPTATPTPTATAKATASATTPGPSPAGSSPRSPVFPPTPAPIPPPAGAQPLPHAIRPPLGAAETDWEPLVTDGCTLGNGGTAAHGCVFGDPNGSTTVALVGDSHAAQWFPAVERIARARHWRLVTYTKISCRFFDLPIYSRVMKREYTECEAWRPNVVAALRRLRPALTIVSVAGGMQPVNPADDDPTRQGIATARLLASVPGAKAIIVDTPQSQYDVPTCLANHLGDVRGCLTSRAYALSWRHLKLERAAAGALPNAKLVDLTNAICPWNPCPVVLNGMIVYRDSFHLTATFDASLAAALDAALPDLSPAPPPAPSPTPVPSPSPTPFADPPIAPRTGRSVPV